MAGLSDSEVLPVEQSVPCPSFPGGEASTHGRIRSLRQWTTPRVLSPSRLSSGYLMLLYQVCGAPHRTALVRRVVLDAFSGPCPVGCEGSHRNGVRNDNRPGNLAWETALKNHAHKVEHGAAVRGERATCRKLTLADVREIRASRGRVPKKVLAARFGVTKSNICMIQRGRTWAGEVA